MPKSRAVNNRFLRCACHQHQFDVFAVVFFFFAIYLLENALIHFSFYFLIYYLAMRIAILTKKLTFNERE